VLTRSPEYQRAFQRALTRRTMIAVLDPADCIHVRIERGYHLVSLLFGRGYSIVYPRTMTSALVSQFQHLTACRLFLTAFLPSTSHLVHFHQAVRTDAAIVFPCSFLFLPRKE